MRRDTIPARHLLLIPLGFVIWSLGFVTLYATNAFGCAFGWAEPTQRGILVALALGFILMTVLAAIFTGLAGWHGGKLVFDHGVGLIVDPSE